MQLNRATNQFFSKKVKETIQSSMLFQKPVTSERKTHSSVLEEMTFSLKSFDEKEKKEAGFIIYRVLWEILFRWKKFKLYGL